MSFGKGKRLTLERAAKAQRGVTAVLEGDGYSAPGSGRSTPGKDPVLTVYESGRAPGPVRTGAVKLALTEIRSPDRAVRSESLYRLSCPGPLDIVYPWYVKSTSLWFTIKLLAYLLTYFTYLLTPCSRVLLDKLSGFKLVKKFPAFYLTRMFITSFTSARYLSLSLASLIQSLTHIPLTYSLHAAESFLRS